VRVLGVRELERLGAGALLAVGRGSVHPPCLIVLERGPAPARASRKRSAVPPVVLIGKGVTFDTGGISIKPREGMARMKYDMSGAAAVIGVFAALPTIDPPFRVVGLLPCAENMPGGQAMKPGDVVRTMDGATVEVTNTDAEGRLVLADALCFARTLGPARIVDIATLTGSIRIALGPHAAGLFSRDDALASELERAARRAGEAVWRMPLGEEYAAELRSDTADLVNFAGRDGGACIAASFLARFAGTVPWAHLDIASTGWAAVERPDARKGPTGFGVRLLLAWLSDRAAASERASASRLPPAATVRRAGAPRALPPRGTSASASGPRATSTRTSRTTGR
jgi:leucyl aminopeptidase